MRPRLLALLALPLVSLFTQGCGDSADDSSAQPSASAGASQGGSSQGGSSQGGTSQGGSSQGGDAQGGSSQGGESAQGGAGGMAKPIPTGVEIDTAQGKVKGASADKVRSWKGIPYAAPPVGDLRFRAPQPASAWEGTRDTLEFGASCAQASIITGEYDKKSAEDCLTLNVYSPDPAPTSARPVMVWMHGGAFVVGSSSNAIYEGTRFVQQTGVVLVTINYRLGAFGFMAHPDLGNDADGGDKGNWGILDQRAALAWVRDNIAAFGGNPDNVTIFGESAGGFSVSAHLISPGSDGLFHRAVIQSGAASVVTASIDQAKTLAEKVSTSLGCTGFDAACLRSKPAEELAVALNNAKPLEGGLLHRGGRTPLWFPVLDGVGLTQQPYDAFASGKIAKVPVIVGTTLDEGRLFHAQLIGDVAVKDEAGYDAVLQRSFKDDAAKVKERYPLSNFDNDPNLALAKIDTDWFFTCSARRVARAVAAAGQPVYRFQLTRPVDAGIGASLGVPHSMDLYYLFGNDDTLGRLGDDAQPLIEQVMGYWSSFADKGAPEAKGAPAWTPFSQGDAYLDINLPPTIKDNLEADACDFFDTLPPPGTNIWE